MQKYTIVFIALAGLITIAMAQPVEQQQQQLIVPALDSVVVEATSQAEAVRKVRQLLGGFGAPVNRFPNNGYNQYNGYNGYNGNNNYNNYDPYHHHHHDDYHHDDYHHHHHDDHHHHHDDY